LGDTNGDCAFDVEDVVFLQTVLGNGGVEAYADGDDDAAFAATSSTEAAVASAVGSLTSAQRRALDCDRDGDVDGVDLEYLTKVLEKRYRLLESINFSPFPFHVNATLRKGDGSLASANDTKVQFEVNTTKNKGMVFSIGGSFENSNAEASPSIAFGGSSTTGVWGLPEETTDGFLVDAVEQSSVAITPKSTSGFVQGGRGVFEVVAYSNPFTEPSVGVVLVVTTTDDLGRSYSLSPPSSESSSFVAGVDNNNFEGNSSGGVGGTGNGNDGPGSRQFSFYCSRRLEACQELHGGKGFVPLATADIAVHTPYPSPVPTPLPTPVPSPLPTPPPTELPTASLLPSQVPTISMQPTSVPSPHPTMTLHPTAVPTLSPSPLPTLVPSFAPTALPTLVPTPPPTPVPSPVPTFAPYAVMQVDVVVGVVGFEYPSDLEPLHWQALRAAFLDATGPMFIKTGEELLNVTAEARNVTQELVDVARLRKAKEAAEDAKHALRRTSSSSSKKKRAKQRQGQRRLEESSLNEEKDSVDGGIEEDAFHDSSSGDSGGGSVMGRVPNVMRRVDVSDAPRPRHYSSSSGSSDNSGDSSSSVEALPQQQRRKLSGVNPSDKINVRFSIQLVLQDFGFLVEQEPKPSGIMPWGSTDDGEKKREEAEGGSIRLCVLL
jgi:hypothetical protein